MVARGWRGQLCSSSAREESPWSSTEPPRAGFICGGRGSCFIVNQVYYFPHWLDVFLKVVTLWRVNLVGTRYSVWVCLIFQIMFILCGLGLPHQPCVCLQLHPVFLDL